jgi:AAA domain
MPNKPLIAIAGSSGTGKSSSLRNLNPQKTRILDLERKGFPFKNIKDFTYVKPSANLAELKAEISLATKPGACEVLVIESFTVLAETLLAASRGFNKGYEIYTWYNQQIGAFLKSLKNENCIVICTAIDEIVSIPLADGNTTSKSRIMVSGKEWEGKIEKEFLMVLFTEARRQKDGQMKYFFQTNTDGLTSAKTPMGMFSEQYIENDMQKVIEAINEYYK